MNFVVGSSNAGPRSWFRRVYRPRELFLHDGATLRGISVGVPLQLAVTLVLALLLAWSGFSAVRLIGGVPSTQSTAQHAQVEAMEEKVAGMAARLERRQAVLAALVTGRADAATLAAMFPEDASVTGTALLADAVKPLAAIEGRQLALANQAADAADKRYHESATMLRRLGVDPSRLQHKGAALAMGGPYEPVPGNNANDTDPQFRALFASYKRLDQLQQGVMSIPSLRPVRIASFTSGYGVRSDPFRGSAAMHAGIDMAGPVGTPIYAAADGLVGRAQWANGYGNLVELEHGRGIQTRYGHLSAILVRAGQRVRRGDLIARMGSTGRSTGSHLHYEVRLDGRAVNPVPFLQSSEYLVAMQQRAPGNQVALGGPEN